MEMHIKDKALLRSEKIQDRARALKCARYIMEIAEDICEYSNDIDDIEHHLLCILDKLDIEFEPRDGR